MSKPADFLARSRVGTARSRVKGAPWTQKPRDSAGPSRVSRMSKSFDDPYMRESDPRDPHDEFVLLSRKVKNHLDTLDGAKDSAAFDGPGSENEPGHPGRTKSDQGCIAPGNWPYLSTDDVVWLPSEGRWVGRTSPKLTKEVREAAALARKPWHDVPAPAVAPAFDDLF
jgi:hypothetical protein